MINLAKLKDAGAVNFRARYLAVHRRSKLTVRSLIDVGAGRGNSSPVCPRTFGRKDGHGSSAPALNRLLPKSKSIQERMVMVPPPQHSTGYYPKVKAYKAGMGMGVRKVGMGMGLLRRKTKYKPSQPTLFPKFDGFK
jgi:hypothetical protein